MDNQAMNHKLESELLNLLEGELLDSLLQGEDTYPWNPSEAETEAYFDNLESEFPLNDWSEEDINSRSTTLFTQMHSCWANSQPSPLKQGLMERFGNFLPSSWLEEIATQIQENINSNLSQMEKLICAVQPLMAGWSEEDLQVFARPLVSAMRSNRSPNGDALFARLNSSEWEKISPMDKAKASLHVAQYALSQLQVQQ